MPGLQRAVNGPRRLIPCSSALLLIETCRSHMVAWKQGFVRFHTLMVDFTPTCVQGRLLRADERAQEVRHGTRRHVLISRHRVST